VNKTTKKINKQPTMHDVARLAGVSQPTVSRVLNQQDTTIAISEDTRAKVMAAVEALGYRTNVLARSLRTQKNQMIALLIADISNSFYHPIARTVQEVARQHNYDVMIANSDHLYENEIHFFEAVTRRPVDGVIMVPIHLSKQEFVDFIAQTNTPIAVLGKQIEHDDIDVVYLDDEEAIYQTVCWLITARGHREIGFVGVGEAYPPGPRRLHGFERAMYDSGLPINPDWMLIGDFTMEGGKRAANELLQRDTLPTAMFVVNDLMAIGMILTLQEAGLRVPEDIAVVGFDNIPETTIVRPTLTTIAQNPADIGQKLATMLFDRIENPELPRRLLESPYELVVRGSA
jgi:LacI family transcriptional regulator